MDVKIPEKLLPIYQNKKRFTVLYGGRGSAKSWALADKFIIEGYREKHRVLCTREIQKSISDSVLRLLRDRIDYYGLTDFYTITQNSIRGKNGTEFLFKGLRHNPQDIKSTEGVSIAWVEEAQSVSRESLEILVPTIRQEGSQIYFSMNLDTESDVVYTDYILPERDDTLVIKINYYDNPFFPDVLRADMEYDKRIDYDRYLHVWEGEPKNATEACIFKGKYTVESFDTPEDAEFFYGADWGFSQDPTCIVRCFIQDNCLYIDREAYGIGVEIEETPSLFNTMPGIKNHKVVADNARPELISYMNQKGFVVRSAKKGANSIIEGVEYLRSFEKIIIHPDCNHAADEFKFYSYKTDRLTGEVLPVIVDKHNHIIDALRYSLEDMRKYNSAIKPPAYTLQELNL
jgi:phage terminase large subunit